MKVGVIGLGRMGAGIAQKLREDGHEILAWNRSDSEHKNVESIEELVKTLPSPRVIWIMVPHNAVEEVLKELKKFVEKGDIVIDGGNSNYKDTDRRFNEYSKMEIYYLGIGVSGGIIARKEGYPLMAGGSKEGYGKIKPILESLSKPNGGYEYFGTGGAGHFVKMVHNGIEYGMMQSLGEGFEILEKSKYELDLVKVSKLWEKGTIISGFLVDRASEMLTRNSELTEFEGSVSRSGEGDWTLEAANEEDVDAGSIELAVEYRKKSETNEKVQKSFTARMINALRNAFGGHQIKKS